jgi:hypothetical protein
MALPVWSDVRESLTAAIRAALPIQVRKAAGERIVGVGLHIDGYFGSAGLYLLPESAARALSREAAANLGDWPISTDWDPSEDHARAFAASWGRWDDWFHNHLDDLTAEEKEVKPRSILRVACEAMRRIEADGLLDSFPKTEDFRCIIAEHDEPDALAIERYGLFVRTGTVKVYGEAV